MENIMGFIPDGRIRKGSLVLASATEMDSTFSSPLFEDAHVTVQQITPADGSVRVRTWVDSVPVNINLRLQIAVLGTVTVPVQERLPAAGRASARRRHR
ncbi:hypothetical protein ACF08B_36380 [Streptomyces sp. NPDC015139]|uniref:hypothetical protein n=1 Tax=Streptomyces sp. NPDC015139 TaxID=3364942 RepID=UPI0036FD067F